MIGFLLDELPHQFLAFFILQHNYLDTSLLEKFLATDKGLIFP